MSATGWPKKMILLCATGAGVGYAPIIPGTVATLVAVPFSIGLNRLANVSLLAASATLVVAILCAISLAGKAAEILQKKTLE